MAGDPRLTAMNPKFENLSTAQPNANAFDAGPAVHDPPGLQRELAEQKSLYERLAADFENFKRRTRQDGEARAVSQKDSFIVELLPALDNLERALASDAAGGSPQFRQGVAMTLRQLLHLLAQHGIETEESVGQIFDPRRHEAVSQRNDPRRADRSILEVFQRGYRRGEKVFRPARVVVNDLTPFTQGPHVR